MSDLHKRIAKQVRSKQQREEAQKLLRRAYGDAIKGTAWEELAAVHDAHSDPVDPFDPIEFYEVELRGIAEVWPDEGMGHAWVWQDDTSEWTYVPALVNKAWLEGSQYSRRSFLREFPHADLEQLEKLASVALDRA